MDIVIEVLRVLTIIGNALHECRRYVCRRRGLITEYYLSFDGDQPDEIASRVPEDYVHIQIYETDAMEKKAIVTYDGEEIVYARPTARRARSPWLWIGDLDSGTDLTEALEMYCVPGNKIHYDLLVHLLRFGKNTSIQYLTKTLQMVDFPEEGIVIEANE